MNLSNLENNSCSIPNPLESRIISEVDGSLLNFCVWETKFEPTGKNILYFGNIKIINKRGVNVKKTRN